MSFSTGAELSGGAGGDGLSLLLSLYRLGTLFLGDSSLDRFPVARPVGSQ